jgi:hypothetical protein
MERNQRIIRGVGTIINEAIRRKRN